jgi:DNA-binding response OmpR family regulator
MPNIDGYELAMEIRKTNRLIPIVICSGFTDKDKLMNAMKIGVIKYIEKPLKFDDLMNTMDDVAKMLKKENLLRIEILKNLSYDYINKNLLKDTTIILSLTKKEISLIEYLLKKRSMLCNYEELSYEIFGEEIDVNTLRNVVYRVQKKIELNFIIAVKELGYMIV